MRFRGWPKLVRSGFHALGAAGAAAMALLVWQAHDFLAERQQQVEARRGDALKLIADGQRIRTRHAALTEEIGRLPAQVQPIAQSDRWADDAKFMAQVSDLAQEYALALKEFRPSRTAQDRLEIRISLAGPFAGFCQFLDGLRARDPLFQVAVLDLVAPNQANGNCAIELTMCPNAPAVIP